jgi:hypothetical protein
MERSFSYERLSSWLSQVDYEAYLLNHFMMFVAAQVAWRSDPRVGLHVRIGK